MTIREMKTSVFPWTSAVTTGCRTCYGCLITDWLEGSTIISILGNVIWEIKEEIERSSSLYLKWNRPDGIIHCCYRWWLIRIYYQFQVSINDLFANKLKQVVWQLYNSVTKSQNLISQNFSFWFLHDSGRIFNPMPPAKRLCVNSLY